jgi:hypothetical protein
MHCRLPLEIDWDKDSVANSQNAGFEKLAQ